MIKLVNRESGSIRRRLKEIADAISPDSSRMTRFRTELSKIRKADNIDMLTFRGSGLAGEDRFGRGLTPLGEWANGAAFRRRGNGPVLAPRGLGSRMITNFYTAWTRLGNGWRMTDGWRGIPWVIYHLQGCAKGSSSKRPNWSLPRRDVGGWSLKGLVQARAAFARLAQSILRKGSSSG